MIRPVQIKVCGLTRESDIEQALQLGADYCGIIVYPKSPRAVSMERAADLIQQVPVGKRVMVDVETSTEALAQARDLGFDYYQIHASLDVGLATLAAWSGIVGRERLWIAPRIPPGAAFPTAVLEFADTVLVDTYSKTQAGGTGQTGDWSKFAALSTTYPNTNWILAGGLGPDNVVEALAATGAHHFDINSGVESTPGLKDLEKLKAAFRALRPES